MKHFIVEIIYTVPYEQIATVTPKHREFLQQGYDKGWLLMSGPQNPKIGGIVVCRAPSLEEIRAFFNNDPYFLAKMTEYHFTEFEPVKRAPFIESWFE